MLALRHTCRQREFGDDITGCFVCIDVDFPVRFRGEYERLNQAWLGYTVIAGEEEYVGVISGGKRCWQRSCKRQFGLRSDYAGGGIELQPCRDIRNLPVLYLTTGIHHGQFKRLLVQFVLGDSCIIVFPEQGVALHIDIPADRRRVITVLIHHILDLHLQVASFNTCRRHLLVIELDGNLPVGSGEGERHRLYRAGLHQGGMVRV